VQNLPLPGDRRVWLECQALVAAGYQVTAITPKGKGDPDHEYLDGVHLYKYSPPPATTSTLSFFREFAECWLKTARLARRVRRRHGFDVLQACNPPDTYFALAALVKPFGVRFVFDQHDLCPEVYLSRFDRPSPWLTRALLALERLTYRTADAVISTNESYRRVALSRGRVRPDRVTVVRTGPDENRMRRGRSDPALRRGRRHLVAYVGVMGPQDGVEVLVEAVDHLVHGLSRTDTWFAIMGSGDCWAELKDLVARRGLTDHVHMPGRVSDEELFATLSTADVGVCPDLPGPLNDVSTMNKTMEYMAFEVPVLAFDLPETRVSAGEAAEYVAEATPAALAKALSDLLDRPADRERMGRAGRRRVEDELAWRHQSPRYVEVFDRLVGRVPVRP
jgi:glycosyltransferase involved in cell wall biosynthesis